MEAEGRVEALGVDGEEFASGREVDTSACDAIPSLQPSPAAEKDTHDEG